MTRKLFYFLALFLTLQLKSQNPGLVISEVFANPAGTDSCKEYVELLAVQNINFSLTPYTIIVNNNGSANANGWVAGGALSYAFGINSGSVAAGTVVYVGGSCMTPTTNPLRLINVKYIGGDWSIGSPNASGVFGNGGSNADGVAVFNLPVSSITSSTIPTDAIFFGTGIGTSSVNAGLDGYQLPVNDFYSGGKLNSTSFLAPDPASDIVITTTGVYNMATASWSVNRSISTGTTMSDGVSSVSLVTTGTVSPATVSFVSNDTTATESTASASIFMRLTGTSTASSSISVYATAFSNASASDYTIASATFTFPANAPVNSTAAITFSINNDALIESSEYAILRFYNPQNMNIGTIQQCAFYITDNDKPVPAATNALTLNLLSSFSNSFTGSNSAEIVVHDPTTQRLYIANSIGGKLDIVDFANPSSPSLLLSVPITTYGNINSVAVRNGTVACAIENSNPQDSGKVVFFNASGAFISQVKVGMMPDMITFNQAGNKVLTANEGEPNATYSVDPEGSISIIDLSVGVANVTASNVAHITFTNYIGQENALRAQGIRIFGPGANAAKDFEPEYISVSKDDSRAWVTLQENNAVVEINLTTNTITSIRALGTKNHALLDNGLDASNNTKGINVSNFPIKGFYLPDAIASYTVGGVNYYITANEGDTRDYPSAGFTEEVRVASATIDPVRFPFVSQIKNNSVLGRLTITNRNGDVDTDGDLDTLYSIGARSFSIWNATTGNLVYDSKDEIERITATSSFSTIFNCSNTNITRKDRSDDKGPEPEGVAIGQIGSNNYAFIALERIGGVMVYDVTNPATPSFVTYVNNRSTSSTAGDRGAEGIIFIPQSQSPNGQHLVIAANEVSSSLSIWGIPGCTSPLASSLSVSGATNNACASNPPVLSVPSNTAVTYQWSMNGSPISGATSNTFSPMATGNYSVAINGGSNCATGSVARSFTVNPNPTLTISGTNTLCSGSNVSLTASGAVSYSWSSGASSSVAVLNPTSTTIYTVSGANTNSCVGTITTTLVVEAIPQLSLNPASGTICAGQNFSVMASGATTYSWSSGSTSASLTTSPATSTMYVVVGSSTANCISASTIAVVVNTVPVLSVTGGTVICAGASVSQTLTGATTYTWSNGSNGAVVNLSPLATTVYTIMGQAGTSCIGMTTRTINVNALPLIAFSPSSPVFCSGQTGTISVSGATTYSWSTGNLTATLSASPVTNTIYTVLGTNAFNCSSTATIGVTVNPTPIVTIAGNNSVCAGSALTQTANGASTYLWNTGSTNQVLNSNPNSTTSYSVLGTSNGCSSVAVKVVTVVALPVILISQSSPGICAGESATLTASGASTYSWSVGSASNSLVITPSGTTVYTVTGTGNSNCSATAQITQSVSVCASVNELASALDIVIYPNPANTLVTIETGGASVGLSLLNALGEVVFVSEKFDSGNKLNVEHYAKGVYYLVISQNESKTNSVKKLIIE